MHFDLITIALIAVSIGMLLIAIWYAREAEKSLREMEKQDELHLNQWRKMIKRPHDT